MSGFFLQGSRLAQCASCQNRSDDSFGLNGASTIVPEGLKLRVASTWTTIVPVFRFGRLPVWIKLKLAFHFFEQFAQGGFFR
jgi:hypothetical protein